MAERFTHDAKPIPGFSGYKVDRHGTVYSCASNWRGYGVRKMGSELNSYGYPSVRLKVGCGKRKRMAVHRLVALTFLPPRPSATHEIRHLDGNKENNHFANLKWGTASENALDRVKHGTQFYPPWDDPAFRKKALAGMRKAALSKAHPTQDGE